MSETPTEDVRANLVPEDQGYTLPSQEQRRRQKERLEERKRWVAEQRALLNKGELSEDDFDEIVATKIQTRQDKLDAQEVLIDTLRDQVYVDKLAEAESEEALQMYLDELVTSGECFGVVLGDIDHFRDVNSETGHQGGDNAIVKVAERMSKALRRTEENVTEDSKREADRFFRRHGDEFAIVVRKLTPDKEGKQKLKYVMERVKDEVASQPFEITSGDITVQKSLTVSLGGAVTPAEGEIDPDKFIHMVDTQALYQAKDNGRNTTHVLNLDQPRQEAA